MERLIRLLLMILVARGLTEAVLDLGTVALILWLMSQAAILVR